MGFSRQEYWSGLPFPSPGDLPNPGVKPGSPTLQADSLLSESPAKPGAAEKCLERAYRLRGMDASARREWKGVATGVQGPVFFQGALPPFHPCAVQIFSFSHEVLAAL